MIAQCGMKTWLTTERVSNREENDTITQVIQRGKKGDLIELHCTVHFSEEVAIEVHSTVENTVQQHEFEPVEDLPLHTRAL